MGENKDKLTGWIAAIAIALLTAGSAPWWIERLFPPAPVPDTTQVPTARVVWAKNWHQVNQPVPSLGIAGIHATSRSKYLSRLEALDATVEPSIEVLRGRLIQLSRSAPPHDDPFYDMVLTSEIEFTFDELKRQVREKALEQGVDVGHP